jgi:hypothetical protein
VDVGDVVDIIRLEDDGVEIRERNLIINNSHVGWEGGNLEGTETIDLVLRVEKGEVVVVLAALGFCSCYE